MKVFTASASLLNSHTITSSNKVLGVFPSDSDALFTIYTEFDAIVAAEIEARNLSSKSELFQEMDITKEELLENRELKLWVGNDFYHFKVEVHELSNIVLDGPELSLVFSQSASPVRTSPEEFAKGVNQCPAFIKQNVINYLDAARNSLKK